MARQIRIGLIGAGFIGASHALAANAVNRVFADLPLIVRPAVVAEGTDAIAKAKCDQYGFENWTTDWRQAVSDCDAIIIAVPSHLHVEIARYAIERGKHVLCEKPVGLNADDAALLADAARAKEISSAVGFTYLRAPLVRHARKLLDDGLIGAPLHFRGHHCEDYLADPDAPFSWRLDASLAGRSGALGDLGWHILSIARYLCGPIVELSGSVRTFNKNRKSATDPSQMKEVQNEDWAGMTVGFASGASGLIEASRVAHGRKMDIGFELVCERGTVAFHGERLNELRLYVDGRQPSEDGFRTILANASHPDFGCFIPAPGHGNSFNDLKTIEMRDFVMAIAENRDASPDLYEACKIARLCEAAIESSARRQWITEPEDFRTGGAS